MGADREPALWIVTTLHLALNVEIVAINGAVDLNGGKNRVCGNADVTTQDRIEEILVVDPDLLIERQAFRLIEAYPLFLLDGGEVGQLIGLQDD